MSEELINTENQNLNEEMVNTQIEEIPVVKKIEVKGDCSYMAQGGLGGNIIYCNL